MRSLWVEYFPQGRPKASKEDIAAFAAHLLDDIWVRENVPDFFNDKWLWTKFVEEFSWNWLREAGWRVEPDPRCQIFFGMIYYFPLMLKSSYIKMSGSNPMGRWSGQLRPSPRGQFKGCGDGKQGLQTQSTSPWGQGMIFLSPLRSMTLNVF